MLQTMVYSTRKWEKLNISDHGSQMSMGPLRFIISSLQNRIAGILQPKHHLWSNLLDHLKFA